MTIPFGPTYQEMLYPERIDEIVRKRALNAVKENEYDPINLFNITWKDAGNRVKKIVLPSEITGVKANIIVLLGKYFPSGSHKVGPAYSTLIEGCIDGDIIPGKHTILGPSTGNFGIGTAYICKLMGCKCIVIMPDNMSKERYERIKKYGAELVLTPGSESDVNLTLKRTNELANYPNNKVLAQFELFSNYRFHRFVTGNSCIEAAENVGNGKIACFVSAPGSAGTIGAGDEIKSNNPEAVVAALEPQKCPTLSVGGTGHHRIEGVGDKMCTLIHNVLSTDYVVNINDEDTIKGLYLLKKAADILEHFGIKKETAEKMGECFGISSICNIIGAVKMAKHLDLGSEDNVVTIATDGFDRYDSVIEEFEESERTINTDDLKDWFEEVFMNINKDYIFDFRDFKAKERLFRQKEKDWMPFGYSKKYLDSMRTPDFWEKEYEKVHQYDKKILQMRK